MKRATNLATSSGPARSRGSVFALVRLAVATVAVLLFSLAICRPAYALSTNPGVEINGWSLTAFGMDGKEGYLVYAPDNFSAAALSLGYSWDEVQGFTDQQRSYMTNASTGGDFYTYAQRFEELSASTPSLGEDADYAWAMGYLQSNQVIWGGRVYNDAWAINTTRDWRSDAKQKIGDILDGNLDEGGGDTPVEGIPSTFTLKPIYYDPRIPAAQQQYNSGLTVNVNMSEATRTALSRYLEEYPYFYAYAEVYAATTSYHPGGMVVNVGLSKQPYTWPGNNVNIVVDIQNMMVQKSATYSDSVYTLELTNTTVTRRNNININVRDASGNVLYFLDGMAGAPVDPPNNWPDTPENPIVDPPTVPEPPSGPIVEPPNIPIQPTPPYPSPPVVEEPTVPVTPDLSDILEAMNEHCIHLQDAMHREAENIDTDMRAQIGWLAGAISDTIESLDGDIELYFKHLEDYLYDLFHWLADQFDFSFGEYDDSSVLYWLRMIYSKLGRGGSTTKPSDPVTDPIGIGDWIKQLIDNFLLDLIAIGAGDLADVIADFRDLARKFPFSVPWDLAAMLALLVAQPVTPVIDFPWYSITASGLVSTTVHIDLSAWNATMEPIRLMEKLAFCMLLASRSKDLLDFIRLGRGDG